MVDNVELQAACAALGYLDDDKYHKEPDCLETVKDLIRFLRRDSDSCEVRRQLGEAEIVSKDLLPIIKHYHTDCILFDTVIRLLANLTQPAKLCFHNHVPEDKTQRNYYIEIEGHLQSYKAAFADEILFAVFAKKLGDLLKLDWERRQEEDRLLIERLLIVIRNILHVPPNIEAELRTDDDASIHDQVLWALHVSGLEDLLLYVACSDDERQFAFHVLEIVSLMFREQTAEQLASAGGTRAASEKQNDERELVNLLERERHQRKANVLKYSSRHSRFGGTFVVANMKSISDRNLIYHSSLGNVDDFAFDRNKTARKRPKNRRPILDSDAGRRSTLSIRLYLREFCTQFLESCYNPLMRAVKDLLVRAKAQDSDETYYLWAMRFFMEFNRRADFKVALVSETLSVNTFHYVQVNLQTYHDMSLQNKKEAIIWSRRMHLALKAYGELLHCVSAMDISQEAAIRNSAQVIKSNVFYMMEYRETFLMLLKHFDETRQSRTFLRDLVESTHLYLRMLENFCKKNSHVVVQKKKKKMAKRKRPKTSEQQNQAAEMTEADREAVWDEVSSDLSALLQGRGNIPDGITPFDAASTIEIEQQRIDAVYKVQELLHAKQPGEALAMFRAAREVWPGRAEFGSEGISPEDEFMALRELCFTPLPSGARSFIPVEEQENIEPLSDEGGEAIAEEETAGVHLDFVEQEFNFKEFVLRFSQPQVVRAYVILLADFARNSAHTNHCTAKMLHRVAFDHQLPSMLYQARLFRVFNRLLTDNAFRSASQYEELRQFAKHVLRKFFETMQSNDKVVVELFFWKSAKEAIEITEGYGSTQSAPKVKQIWSEQQDDELRMLFAQFSEFNNNKEDGGDLVDYIMSRMVDQTKTRRQVIRQLTHLDLIGGAKELKRRSGAVRQRGWTEEQEVELRCVFEQSRESDDIIGSIMTRLSLPRSKPKLVEKILELGLVSDKKELHKKRKRGDGTSRRKRKDKNVDDDDDDDSITSERGRSPASSEDDASRSSSDSENDVANDDVPSTSGENDRPPPRRKSPPPAKVHRPKRGGDTKDKRPQKKSSKAKMPTVIPGNVMLVHRAVMQLEEQGLDDALRWLRNSLIRTAEDREEDGNDDLPIPLVPLLEEQEDATELSVFQDLMRHCGLNPPANEQERYWRIAGSIRPEILRRCAAAFDSEPPAEEAGEDSGTARSEIPPESPAGDSSEDESPPGSPRSPSDASSRSSPELPAAETTSNDEAMSRHKFLQRKNDAALAALVKKRQTVAVVKDSEPKKSPAVNSKKSPLPSSTKQRSRLKRIVSSILTSSDDSDSDDGSRLVIDSAAHDSDNESSVAMATLAPESEEPSTRERSAKRARIVDSDSEDEDGTNNTAKDGATSQRAAITSDSEDEMVSRRHDNSATSFKGRKRVAVESDSE